MEFRTNSGGTSDEEIQKALETIENISKKMKFPEPTKAPMLLANGDVVDAAEDVVNVSVVKAKATHRTTNTTKKKTNEGTSKNQEI